MRLLPNLWQVACPNVSHRFDATAYLIDLGGGLLLVDCGTPEGYGQIVENIRRTGHDPRDIRAILGTHGHYDHVGAASLFMRDFGVPLLLHAADRRQVEEGDGVRTTASLLYGADFPPAAVADVVEDGQVFAFPDGSVEVIHTPGHTPGSVCYVLHGQDTALLIAGDTLWGGASEKIGTDMAAWHRSMDKLCARHFDFLTFGHTSPLLFGDADCRLAEAREQLDAYGNPWFKAPAASYRY